MVLRLLKLPWINGYISIGVRFQFGGVEHVPNLGYVLVFFSADEKNIDHNRLGRYVQSMKKRDFLLERHDGHRGERQRKIGGKEE